MKNGKDLWNSFIATAAAYKIKIIPKSFFSWDDDSVNCESVIRKPYCELGDCYCELADDICEGNCDSCWYWEDAHPYCEYKDGECEDPEIESCDGEAQFCEYICCECPHYKEHIKAMKAEKGEEDRQEEDI